MPRTEKIGQEGEEFEVALTWWEVALLVGLIQKKRFGIEDANSMEKTQGLYAKLKALIEPTLPGV